MDETDDADLYDMIYASFIKHRDIKTEEDRLYVHELTLEALAGVQEYVHELHEAIEHLQETIKRLRG